MKKARNLLLVLLAAVLCLLLLTGCGEKDVTVSVTLVNRSGREISSISITPSTSTEWDTEFVDGAFADGETISANLGTYKESEVPSAYNILVYNDENYILYDTSVDELDFAIQDGDYIIFLPPEGEVPIEIAHDYDPSDYDEADATAYVSEETEPTLSGDLSGYTGCWKLADEPFYFVINEDYEWIAINLYGEQVGPGYVVDEGENITLCMEDDSRLVSLWQTAYGALSDANGNTLTAMDYIMLLPTPEDDLNQTASFPGGFTNVTIDYPIQMEAHEQPNVSNALSFNAVMEDGTDDYYSNIMIAFQPIEGFDPYMEKGAATAKAYMVKMLDDFMKSMYGSYLIKSFGSDFKDNGDYYSLTGYMWRLLRRSDPAGTRLHGGPVLRPDGLRSRRHDYRARKPHPQLLRHLQQHAHHPLLHRRLEHRAQARACPAHLLRRFRRLRHAVLLVRRGRRRLVLERL